MLLIPEKLYVAIEVSVDEDRRGNEIYWPYKLEIPADDIKEWMRSTGRKYPHGWRLRDYLRQTYGKHDSYDYFMSEDEDVIDYLFVDYVFKVPEGVPKADNVSHVLYRKKSNGSNYCAVQLKTGEIYVAGIRPLERRNNVPIELGFSELVTDRDDWFGAVAERCNERRWGQLYEENASELFEKNISDEMPDFADAYYIDEDYDKMVLAMAQSIAWEMRDRDGFHSLDCNEDFERLFDERYYTNGTDRNEWEEYAEEHGLDPEDDDERWEFYDTCDEFAMARYKIDYDCITPVKTKTAEILKDCFYPLYEF